MRKDRAGQIKKAVQLPSAERALRVYGRRRVLSDASVELRELSACGFPCTNTLMGLARVSATDRQFLGMLGMHGTPKRTWRCSTATLLAIGARFDDRVIGNPAHFAQNPRKIVHIDIDPSSISRVKVDVPIVGNIPDVLEDLLKLLKGSRGKDISAWWKQIDGWRAKDCLRYDRKSPIIKPQFVLEKLYEVTRAKPSSHRTSASTRCGRRSSTSSTSRDAGSTPVASARWIRPAGGDGRAAREPRGDGGVRHRRVVDPDVPAGALHLQAVPAAHQDHQFEQQVHGHGAAVAGVLPRQPLLRVLHGRAARFVKLAEGYGHRGVLVEKPADVEPVLREAFAAKNDLVFLDFITDQKENVYPMVPGGKGITEMILYEEL